MSSSRQTSFNDDARIALPQPRLAQPAEEFALQQSYHLHQAQQKLSRSLQVYTLEEAIQLVTNVDLGMARHRRNRSGHNPAPRLPARPRDRPEPSPVFRARQSQSLASTPSAQRYDSPMDIGNVQHVNSQRYQQDQCYACGEYGHRSNRCTRNPRSRRNPSEN